MRVFLAGTSNQQEIVMANPPLYVLESFYYFKEWQKELIPKTKQFFVDSGAFTFRSMSKNEMNWDALIEQYAAFILKNNINYFFEMDIDNIIGYDRVLKLNEKLERITKKRCIPVWHPSRGIENFHKMCDEYSYVSLGGIVGAKKNSKKYQAYYSLMPQLIKIAHKHGARIHGLGYTATSTYDTVKFDSVDSTTWTIGGRMGNACYFTGSRMRQWYPSLHSKKPEDMSGLTQNNYTEWLKFQKWAEVNL